MARRSSKKVPSAAKKTKAMTSAMHKSMTTAIAAVKKAEQAKAEAEKKVFAAKLIAHIAKEAGIKGPPASVKKKAIAQAKKKAAAAKKLADRKVADARKKAASAKKRAARAAKR